MFNYNNGYIGSKMSIRASNAYEEGLKPYSKWSKSDILDYFKEEAQQLKKYSTSTLKSYFLHCEEWHHTGSYFNKTDFYSIREVEDIDWNWLDSLEKNHKQELEEKKNNKPEYKKVKAHYVEWSGTRKHPKAIDHEELGIISGNWCYFLDGTKKSTSGNYFNVLEYYDKAPKGTAETFNKIIKNMQK